MSVRHRQRLVSLSILGLLAGATLTGCGSSSSTTTGSGGPQTFRSGGPGAGFSLDPALQKKVQRCLKAAGIQQTFPTGRPSRFVSGGPSGSPPTGFPSGAPTGKFTAGPGGGFQSSEVQSALKACGITLPRPTASPSS